MKSIRSFYSWATLACCCLLGCCQAQTLTLQAAPGGTQILSAAMDGHAGLFLFDSGFGVSSVTPAFTKEIGCVPWGNLVGYRATGERVQGPHCNSGVLTTEYLRKVLPTIGVLDLMKYMPKDMPILAGAIGLDAFAGTVITIESGRNRVTVENTASLRHRVQKARPVPIRLVRDGQGAALSVDLGVPTKAGMAWMELDTGNSGPTLISRTIAGLLGLKDEQQSLQTIDYHAYDGIVLNGRAQVLDLILDGDIGRDVLDHWTLTLDLAHEHGWIALVSSSTD